MKQHNLHLGKLEKQIFSEGYTSIIGIDEVGRGCMAGPMVVCGFKITLNDRRPRGVNDSKIISKINRELIFPTIAQYVHHVYFIKETDIDQFGLTITFKRAVADIQQKISEENSLLVVDGKLRFPEIKNIRSIINADALIFPVAAASIIAKVTRDNYMAKYSEIYPEYGFEKHVGYATKAHRDAVLKYGVLDIHRKSYRFIRNLMENEQSSLFLTK